jgi:hypothetical protein
MFADNEWPGARTAMPGANRDKWLQILENLAQSRPDQAEGEWAWLMKQLGLRPEYFLAIHEAIRQGRWRGAENPAGYIKAVARREARRAEQADAATEELTISGGEVNGESLSGEEMMDALEYRQRSRKPAPGPDGTWRAGQRAQTSEGPGAGAAKSRAEFRLKPWRKGDRRPRRKPESKVLQRYAERLERIGALNGKDPRDEPYIDGLDSENRAERWPDWAKWAQTAGLSEWEKKAIEYKVMGVGWTQAMAGQPDAASRRALQAAWRKLERTGERRLRDTKNIFPQDVREEGGKDTDL